MQKRLIDMLEEADLVGNNMDIVVELCGFECAKTLIDKLGGLTIYIPKATSVDPLVKKYIRHYRHKKSSRTIALELNINEKTVKEKMNLLNTELSDVLD